MSDEEILRMEFVCAHEAWYRDTVAKFERDIAAQIWIVLASSHGGCVWEFGIEWHDFNSLYQHRPRRPMHPKLGFFDDSWQAFLDPRIQGLLATLGDLGDGSDPIQPDEFKQLLIDQGFHDATPYTRELPTIKVDKIAKDGTMGPWVFPY